MLALALGWRLAILSKLTIKDFQRKLKKEGGNCDPESWSGDLWGFSEYFRQNWGVKNEGVGGIEQFKTKFELKGRDFPPNLFRYFRLPP